MILIKIKKMNINNVTDYSSIINLKKNQNENKKSSHIIKKKIINNKNNLLLYSNLEPIIYIFY